MMVGFGHLIITDTEDNRSTSIDIDSRCQDAVVIDTSNDA
jgi:hypothetical protein